VIAGAKCSLTKQEIETALDGYAGVTITKLRQNPRKFEMIVDERGFDDSVEGQNFPQQKE
jgi:hypothetical protein